MSALRNIKLKFWKHSLRFWCDKTEGLWKKLKKNWNLYFVVKEGLWISNFVQILKLDGRERVSLGNAYCNCVPDFIIVNFIGKWLLNELKQLWNRVFQYINWWLHSCHRNRGKTHLHCNIWPFSAWNW